MKIKNEVKIENESKKSENKKKSKEKYTFHFLNGEEDIQKLLMKLIACRIVGKYEI